MKAEFDESGDSTDEEGETENPIESDTENDPIVFQSDEEDELDFETDSNEDEESEEEEDSEEDESEEDSEDGGSEEDSEIENPPPLPEAKQTAASKSKKIQRNVEIKVPDKKAVGASKKSIDNKVISLKNGKSNGNDSAKSKNEKNKNSEVKKKLPTVSSTESSDVAKKSDVANENVNEYESDTSDEEDIRNTVGNIPMKWYDDYPHIGYDTDGKKIIKPQKGDQLDNFLKRMEDPDFWRTVKDQQTGQDVILSEADIQLITRIHKQRIPDADFDEYAVS